MDARVPLIHLSHVSVRHREHVVLEDVQLEVSEGELIYLIGRTGSGKSSLLRTLYGDLPLSPLSFRQASACAMSQTTWRKTIYAL